MPAKRWVREILIRAVLERDVDVANERGDVLDRCSGQGLVQRGGVGVRLIGTR